MIKACILTILVMMAASCASPTDYGNIDTETISQIKLLDAYVSRQRLSVEGITAWNFLNQRNHFRNLVVVRVIEQHLGIDETPGAYPLTEDLKAQVVRRARVHCRTRQSPWSLHMSPYPRRWPYQSGKVLPVL